MLKSLSKSSARLPDDAAFGGRRTRRRYRCSDVVEYGRNEHFTVTGVQTLPARRVHVGQELQLYASARLGGTVTS